MSFLFPFPILQSFKRFYLCQVQKLSWFLKVRKMCLDVWQGVLPTSQTKPAGIWVSEASPKRRPREVPTHRLVDRPLALAQHLILSVLSSWCPMGLGWEMAGTLVWTQPGSPAFQWQFLGYWPSDHGQVSSPPLQTSINSFVNWIQSYPNPKIVMRMRWAVCKALIWCLRCDWCSVTSSCKYYHYH